MSVLKKLKKVKKEKLFDFLDKNYDAIIEEKMKRYKSGVNLTPHLKVNIATDKIAEATLEKVDLSKVSLGKKEALVVFIANTYLWLDNHEDVHAKNVFSEYLESIYHQFDHAFKLGNRAGDTIKALEIDVEWKDLGIDKEGSTQCLVIVSKIKETYNPTIFKDYLEKKLNQHSVGMWYIDLQLAINNPLNKERFALWKEFIDLIGNKADAESLGYFYVVKKGGVREVSAVLLASNGLTPTLKVIKELSDEKEEEEEDKEYIINFLNNK